MPSQEGARGGDGGQLLEPCQPEFLGLDGQPAALVVVEPGLFAQLLLEDFEFRLKALEGILLVAIERACQAQEEKLKMIHPGRIGVGLQFGQKFGCSRTRTFVGCRIFVSPKRKLEFSDSTRTAFRHCGTGLLLGYSIPLCRGTQRFDGWPCLY
jgi:hypothetical protein